ncbi:type I restriction endonuclease subunit S [Rhodococcus qingshengii]|uniref:Type I restriction endonuclease subunit S n=1 Tax=Rhodococcus qingshengii TaxID=334542 RepID=A0AAW6LPA6_RHOSG|nr:type I restriction endonuclease subunit S [Rhodococcus qingshengii]MDE8649487.1 type I restriction endonuclease subunit S [Rhodococcus qingshengii]
MDLSVEPHEMWFASNAAEQLDLRAGDTVVVEGGVGGYGRAAYVSRDLPGFGFQNSIIRLRADSSADGRYLAHALVSARNTRQIEMACLNAAMPHFTAEKVARFRIPFHEPADRRRIADFLDHETREIDAMLSRMDELVASLRERKADVIQRATVNRDGVFTRLKFRADVSLGKTVQGARKRDDESFVNYVRAASIQHHGLELDDQRMWMTDDELVKYDLRTGDVLIVEGGAGYGRSVVLEADMPGWGFQNHVIRVRPRRDADGRFLNYCVKGHYAAGLIDVMVDGATIPALSSEKARELPIPDLDVEEQTEIANHLDEATARVDAMLDKVAELRALLVERRAALITDVVTGRKEVA